MTPIHLNHPTSTIPILEYKEDHSLQLLSSTQTINRPTPPSTSSFLNLHAHEHAHTIEPIQALAKDEKFIFHGEGENPRGTMPSLWSEQSVKDGNESSQNSSYNIMRAVEMIKPSKESSSSRKHSSNWRSASHPKMGSSKHPVESKPRVRIVHKFQDRGGNKSKNNAVRECCDCHTTTTPLWRSGPQGPKTLCNACGIRQRKARRAMEAAAAAAAARSNNNATVSRANERGSMDASHLLPYKKRGKLLNIGSAATGTTTATSGFYETKKAAASLDDDSSSSAASCLSKDSDSQQRAFPSDEEEAAVLLMALSCGLA